MFTIDNNTFFSTVEVYIQKGMPVTLRVKGTSMFPLLRNERDLVEFHPFKEQELQRGAIVLFRHKQQFIMHRIIKRTGNELIIQGDGICGKYEQASVSDVIALVKTVIRVSGKNKEKAIACSSFQWRFLSASWMLLSPFRRYLLAIYRRLSL